MNRRTAAGSSVLMREISTDERIWSAVGSHPELGNVMEYETRNFEDDNLCNIVTLVSFFTKQLGGGKNLSARNEAEPLSCADYRDCSIMSSYIFVDKLGRYCETLPLPVHGAGPQSIITRSTCRPISMRLCYTRHQPVCFICNRPLSWSATCKTTLSLDPVG